MLDVNRPILNIAHRGARAFAPENTLPAFSKAKHLGCQMFELDVRMSKDGVIVVYHDDHLKRCSDVETKFPDHPNYLLKEFNFTELNQLDVGSWYVEQLLLPAPERQYFLQSLTDEEIATYVSAEDKQLYTSGTVKVPTLDDALMLASQLNLMVNIELKSPIDNLSQFIDGVFDAITINAMHKQILISSFNHDYLRYVKQRNKKLAIATLSDNPIKSPITYLRKLKASAYNIGFYQDYQKDRFVSKAGKSYLTDLHKLSKAGFHINAWTVNRPDEMAYLLAAGVKGLISDYPNRVAEKIKAFARVKKV